jgi:hypothetical protein
VPVRVEPQELVLALVQERQQVVPEQLAAPRWTRSCTYLHRNLVFVSKVFFIVLSKSYGLEYCALQSCLQPGGSGGATPCAGGGALMSKIQRYGYYCGS